MAVPAKLSRPRLAGIYPRERLFARLDQCRRHAAVWISGPPGAGKTTLMASYLDARGLSGLWFQVDSGDADPASFFYYLGMGAKHAGLSRRTHLPLLTPEYLPDLAGFTRRYFRALCQGLPRPCVLVFDNVQEAPEASPFGAVMRDALAELPEGTNAILVSRAEPPAVFARLRASQVITELGWNELRLSEEEATHIAANAHGADTPAIGALVERCGGWAAGLTLLLDHVRAMGSVAETPESRQALFDYFAAELFDRLSAETQQLLLHTALLPWVNVEMAQTLSDNSRAGTLLEGLRRRHLFLHRRSGADVSYEYHALFREFLTDRMERSCTTLQRQQLAHRSAQLLAHARQTEVAIDLYLGAGDTAAAVRLVLGHAPELAAQGRLQTLAGWIGALPAGPEAASPWLGYWLGVCQLGVDPPAARAQLEASFKSFGAACNTLGQTVAAAGIIETYNFELADFTPFDHWIPVLHELLDQQPAFPDPALELGVLAAIIGALVMRKPDRLLLAPRVPRARVLLDLTSDINTRLAGASRLLQYCVFLDDVTLGEQLIAYVRPQLSESRLTAVNVCTWQHMESMFHQFTRYDGRKANASMNHALETMDRNGLLAFAGLLRARAAMLRLEASNLQGAEEQLARAAPLPGGPRFDLGWVDGMQSWLSLLRGEHSTAVQYAQRLVDASAASGAFHPHGMALLVQANALAAAGEPARAFECLRQVAHSFMEEVPQGRVTARLIKADLQLAVGDTASVLTLLQDAFADARAHRLFNTLQWLAPQMSRLCAFAMEHGIETEFVSELVRARGLLPPSPDTQIWPWPIKVHTLSRFEILKDDEPLRFEGKTQRKPLALLKALIALGSADVPEDKLIDIVWAETLEGDEQKAFDVNVHRLRKLLGNDRAIQVTDRRVSLNREIVWVDLWALERKLAAVVPIANAGVPDAEPLERAAPAILNLYRGHFLDGDGDAPWLLPVRNRLSGRFQRFVMRLGDHWEAAGDWGRAAELYERAVELDALAETFYCRQMVCLREQGRRAEAIEVFRRCRQMLSVTLGVKPTEATEAVYRELIGA